MGRIYKYLSHFLLSISIITTSCLPDPQERITFFEYLNASDHYLECRINYYSEEHQAEIGEIIALKAGEKYVNSVNNIKLKPSDTTFYQSASSITLTFNDTTSVRMINIDVKGNPMWLSNYKLIEGENDPYIYLFEFTNEDYKRALLLNR